MPPIAAGTEPCLHLRSAPEAVVRPRAPNSLARTGAQANTRPATARSWARYRGGAIATCGPCSSRRPGSCWWISQDLGPLRAQSLDRRRQEAIAPQCAGDRARQQACPHRMGGSQQGAQLRMREDACDGVPTCMSVAPCSGPSRRPVSPAAVAAEAMASLDGPCARRPATSAGRDEGTA